MSLSPLRSAATTSRAIALGLGVLCACSESQAPDPTERANVLLITLDTTRADRLGCYGYEQANTPILDELASEGVRFERAFSTAGITPVSHASILTGLNNYSHGLRIFYGELGHRLPAEVPSLPAILAKRGWQTAAFVSAYPVSDAYGLARGYQLFQTGLEATLEDQDLAQPLKNGSLWLDGRVNDTQRRSDATTDEALAWLEEHSAQGPWHLWMHFFDVHDFSLVPPAQYAAAANFDYDKSAGLKDVASRERLYDFELGYMDQQLGRVIEHLKRTGQYERTLIVVTSDHGQGLSRGLEDHGWMFHRLLYDWSLHVPLILKLPGRGEGKAIEQLVRTIDILPTILEELDVLSPEGIEGRSLLPLVRGEADEPRFAYADALNRIDAYSPGRKLPARQNDNLYVAMDRRWKLIHHHEKPQHSELYDLANDPQELDNRYEANPEVAKRLLQVLLDQEAFRTRRQAARGPAPDGGALGDLGYTGEDD